MVCWERSFGETSLADATEKEERKDACHSDENQAEEGDKEAGHRRR